MKKALFAAAFAALGSSAMALEPHSYTYLELGWFDRTEQVDIDLPNDDVEGDGFSLAGSYRTADGVLFQAHYSDGEVDKAWGYRLSGSGLSADFRKYGVMVGGTGQATERTSFWGGLGFDREELKLSIPGLGFGTVDVNEWHFGGGVRHTVVEMVELNASLRLIHFRSDGGSDNDAELSVGARFQPTRFVSVGASYARLLDFETDVIKADVRLQY